ncbi:hypothetical protein [Rubrobacter aplysinae]|uniref:hypothetical protein n=1 Tax=Rubrobacter aplysinae TaxID=909625 RepID=UPI00064C1D4E|nr:hypothetical protein [Rubrobacter aplysinae]
MLPVLFVAAFAVFAVLAWILITDAGRRADFYRNRYRETLAELEVREEWRRFDSEYTSRLWEELDTRRMEIKGLEHQLQDVLEENEALHAQLSRYWLQTN